jgi:hypothetical protein
MFDDVPDISASEGRRLSVRPLRWRKLAGVHQPVTIHPPLQEAGIPDVFVVGCGRAKDGAEDTAVVTVDVTGRVTERGRIPDDHGLSRLLFSFIQRSIVMRAAACARKDALPPGPGQHDEGGDAADESLQKQPRAAGIDVRLRARLDSQESYRNEGATLSVAAHGRSVPSRAFAFAVERCRAGLPRRYLRYLWHYSDGAPDFSRHCKKRHDHTTTCIDGSDREGGGRALRKGLLFAQATGQGRFELYPESGRAYFAKVADIVITFDTDERGKGTSLVLQQSGVKAPARRIE